MTSHVRPSATNAPPDAQRIEGDDGRRQDAKGSHGNSCNFRLRAADGGCRLRTSRTGTMLKNEKPERASAPVETMSARKGEPGSLTTGALACSGSTTFLARRYMEV